MQIKQAIFQSNATQSFLNYFT
uniref:Uncharacterized protein n=1 Tax=Anguilla anguilla TaxID=7936 RepID=A0A0E9XBT8_ANGAN